MREYIFTRNEIQRIKQFHQDGQKTQAIRLLKHRCEGVKKALEDDIQVLNDFLNDYASPELHGGETRRKRKLEKKILLANLKSTENMLVEENHPNYAHYVRQAIKELCHEDLTNL